MSRAAYGAGIEDVFFLLARFVSPVICLFVADFLFASFEEEELDEEEPEQEEEPARGEGEDDLVALEESEKRDL